MIRRYQAGMEYEDQDPYRGWSDDGTAQPNDAPDSIGTETQAPEKPVQSEQAAEPKAEKPSTPKVAEPVPAKTFAQMQAAGEARPPMPASAAPLANRMGSGEVVRGTMGSGERQPVAQRGDPAPSDAMVLDPHFITDYAPSGTMGSGDDNPLPPPGIREFTQGGGAPGESAGSSPDWLLSMLTENAQGKNRSPVDLATERKVLGQLESSSPYDSQAVRDEYNWLAGNIDDDFAMQGRALDEGMARRGLYGSAGKDFHSGRLSDLNVGRRSAKTSLAQDLANKYATTKGQYDANAISQGMAASDRDTANRRTWLDSLLGYGQQAFENDLTTADFQQRTNESEQDFLLRMLAMGYGV